MLVEVLPTVVDFNIWHAMEYVLARSADYEAALTGTGLSCETDRDPELSMSSAARICCSRIFSEGNDGISADHIDNVVNRNQ